MNQNLIGFGIVIAVAAVFFLPFLLFSFGRFSGRKMLAFAVGLFGVIIGVNVVLAARAVQTFPGLEVANSYVASQKFDKNRAAQEALGWRAVPYYGDGMMSIVLVDRNDIPAQVIDFKATIGRPTHVREDQTPEFVRDADGVFRAPLSLAPGAWVIHLTAHALDGTLFQQRIDHYHGSRVGANG